MEFWAEMNTEDISLKENVKYIARNLVISEFFNVFLDHLFQSPCILISHDLIVLNLYYASESPEQCRQRL
jgi:hypothetical protein